MGPSTVVMGGIGPERPIQMTPTEDERTALGSVESLVRPRFRGVEILEIRPPSGSDVESRTRSG